MTTALRHFACWLLAFAVLAPVPALAAQDPPPAYPRAGATRVLENDRVIVWDITWLRQEYPEHRHRYDHVGVYYVSGDRIITATDGATRPVSTEAWNISFQRRGVQHTEAGTSEQPLQAVFIQIKDEPRGSPSPAVSEPTFPVGGPRQRLDNDRALVWEHGPPSADDRRVHHGHVHDAVVVSFDATPAPRVRYFERGTEHEDHVPPGSVRTFVFEIR